MLNDIVKVEIDSEEIDSEEIDQVILMVDIPFSWFGGIFKSLNKP